VLVHRWHLFSRSNTGRNRIAMNAMPSFGVARRLLGLLLVIALLGGAVSLADAPRLDKDTLAKVKEATAYLQVRLPDGTISQGSGFFAVEPGLVLTNAHVLGMLEAGSRPPRQIVVVINSGQPSSQVVKGTLLGVDRGSDLALLRVEGKKLPAPLKVGSAGKLIETQDVYVFGFPLGRLIGKNITVTHTTVSSLRTAGGTLAQIQVNGGMHPGNSGGPVIDATGQVVGMSVSVVSNTTISFAIPAEKITAFINGHAHNFIRSAPYLSGSDRKQEISVLLADPLGRVKEVKVDYWTGPLGKGGRPASTTEPKPEPGDSDKQTVTLTYDKKGTAKGEVVLPGLSDPKHVYWMRAVVTDGSGKTSWVLAHGRPINLLLDRKPTTLKYQPKAGQRLGIELTSKGALKIRTRRGEQSMTSDMLVNLVEDVDKEYDGKSNVHMRQTYTGLRIGVKVDGESITGGGKWTPALNSLVRKSQEIEMDPDGALASAKFDLRTIPRVHQSQAEDVTDQVLQSLPLLAIALPEDTLKPLQKWKADRQFKAGPLGYALPARARVEYQYMGLRTLGSRTDAVIELKGTLSGVGSDSGRVGGTVQGLYFVSPKTGEILQTSVTLKVDMDVRTTEGPARLAGELAVRLRRRPLVPKKTVPKKN
jgi:S1-C subfamily serine protease